PPTYTIDLSLAPEHRYDALIAAYRPQLQHLLPLFAEIAAETGLSPRTAQRLAKLFLRRVGSKEQTRELRGISRASGVGLEMLVAFNVLLDLFMGCTSGGVRVRDPDSAGASAAPPTRMLHFRTLDWDMDALRRVIVQLDFVRKPHGAVVARAITYVGFVGVLTGVRRGLSMSLNFRPYHNDDASRVHNLRFWAHLALVLLGWRASVAAVLRQVLIPEEKERHRRKHLHHRRLHSGHRKLDHHPPPPPQPSLQDIKTALPPTPSTAAYLIFSDGAETAVFEKDLRTAALRTSSEFIAVTNSDVPGAVACGGGGGGNAGRAKLVQLPLLRDMLAESDERRECMEAAWRRAETRFRRHRRHRGGHEEPYVHLEDVLRWLTAYPVANEATHLAAVLDPLRGEVVWCRFW
ncbi:uncharacterized protein K452DRAFT_205772, partial [Aplosporella prunicola CBS 121167]